MNLVRYEQGYVEKNTRPYFGPWRRVYVREFKKYPGDPQSQEDCKFVTPPVKDAYIEGRDAYIRKVANPHHLDSLNAADWNRGYYDAKVAMENLTKGDFAYQLSNLEHQLDKTIEDYDNAMHKVAQLERKVEQLEEAAGLKVWQPPKVVS